MKLNSKIFIGLFSFFACFSQADVFAYSNFYIFGDSLSDVGNVGFPLPLNSEGRWTNGLMWNEYLAKRLGLKVPAKSDDWKSGDLPSAGSTNFAHAGGKVKSYFYPITSVEEQINGEWVSGLRDENASFKRYKKRFSDDDLVAIWGGANDYLMDIASNDKWIERISEQAAKEQAENVEALVELGAKNIIVLNLPDIGKAPLVLFPSKASHFSKLFNAAFSKYLDEIIAKNPKVKFFKIDVYALMEDLIKNHEEYGFKFTDIGLVKAYLTDSRTKDSDYIFYDGLHPTTRTHEILADKIFKALKK